MTSEPETQFLRAIKYMLENNWRAGKSCVISFEEEGVYISVISHFNFLYTKKEVQEQWRHKCSPKFVKEFKQWLNVPSGFYHQIKSVEFDFGKNSELRKIFREEFQHHLEKKFFEAL